MLNRLICIFFMFLVSSCSKDAENLGASESVVSFFSLLSNFKYHDRVITTTGYLSRNNSSSSLQLHPYKDDFENEDHSRSVAVFLRENQENPSLSDCLDDYVIVKGTFHSSPNKNFLQIHSVYEIIKLRRDKSEPLLTVCWKFKKSKQAN